MEILKDTEEKINPQVLMLPALDRDELLNQKLLVNLGGHHVYRLSWLSENIDWQYVYFLILYR